ncbi:MAG: MFS transporter [Chitinophagaceae bacterium]|nr:MAG: MFS transporter [Chitinophagaceae bacterium]
MSSYSSICICAFILSMVNEAFRPANATAIAHYSNKKNRTQSFSLVRLAINLGFGVGIGVGGLLASIDYHLLFWVDGCTNVVAALTLLVILPKVTLEQQKKPQEEQSPDVTMKEDRSALKDRDFLFFLIFVVLFGICFFQVFTTVPIFMKENLMLKESLIGIVMAMNGLVIALFEMLIVYKLEGRRPYLYLISLGTVLMAVAFLFLDIPLANGFVVALLAVFILTIAEMVAMPFMNSYYISRSPEKKRGQYAGFYTMAWSVAQVVGSSAGAILAQKMGFLHLWWVVACLCLLAAGGFYWLLLKKIKLA